MKFIFSIILFFSIIISFAQSITNVTSVQQGNDAIITYDLNGNPSSSYYVKLYYSTDNGSSFSNELTQVSGDVKSGVKSGKGKKIIWAADKEVNYLNGQVIFKVEADSRLLKAKPAVVHQYSVEVTSASRTGEDVIIEFIFIQNSDLEVRKFTLLNSSQLTTTSGMQVDPIEGYFGTKKVEKVDHRFNDENDNDCSKGIPVKGKLKFKIEDEGSTLISAVKFDFMDNEAGDKLINLVVRNIPLQ